MSWSVARRVTLTVGLMVIGSGGSLSAQHRAVTRGRSLAQDATISVRGDAGSVRVTGWDLDSIMLSGTFPVDAQVIFGGDRRAVKVGVWGFEGQGTPTEAHFEVFVPRGANVYVKTVSASIAATDVAGSFATAAGHIVVRGTADRVEAEALDGDMEIDVVSSWVRARTGGGALSLRGDIEDAAGATVDGRLSVEATGMYRGSFQTISGDTRFTGSLRPDGVYDFDSHSGIVELILDEASVKFDLGTVRGVIYNQLDSITPAEGSDERHLVWGESLAGGGRVVVRTFKGSIVLRDARD